MSLKLETNLVVYGPYGKEKGLPFELPALHGQIIGFHAIVGKYVNAIGVYVMGITSKWVLGDDSGGSAKDMDHMVVTPIVKSTAPIIKKGPIGGFLGLVKDMDPTGITRIVKISICHGYYIKSLTMYFERDGTTQTTEQWGADGGSLTEIKLKSNEYITSVKEYINPVIFYDVVRSLVLETNLSVYGPYGGIPKEEDEPFEFPALGGQIIGFHARCEWYINAIGVYVQGSRRKSVLCGGNGGSAKDMDLTGITRIVKVTIRHSKAIDALSVCYVLDGTTKCTSLCGGEIEALSSLKKKTAAALTTLRIKINKGSLIDEIDLKPNEYITSVRGYVGYFDDIFIVRSLEIKTNLGHHYGPYGKEEGTPFEHSLRGCQIIGFHGCSGEYLDAIGVYFQMPPR